jgi:mono/diheme cytochrome c family protein
MNVQMEQGRLVFMEHCHHCHPGGEGGLGPGLNDKPLPGFLMKTQVRLGMGVMPSFDEKDITPEQLDALVEYLARRRLRPSEL